MNKATYNGQVLVTKRGGETLEKKDLGGTMPTNLPLGNGKAKAGQTRGFKHWMSRRDHEASVDSGISVEATVTVMVTCGQSEKAILAAVETCGNIAEEMAVKGVHDMDDHIRRFLEGES